MRRSGRQIRTSCRSRTVSTVLCPTVSAAAASLPLAGRYVSEEEWPSDKYPPWAHGAGYVLSVDLAAQVASGAAAVWFWTLQRVCGAALVEGDAMCMLSGETWGQAGCACSIV